MPNYTDSELKTLWYKFGNIPINSETEEIEEAFLWFPVGTDRFEIWDWFDQAHSKGVFYLSNNRRLN